MKLPFDPRAPAFDAAAIDQTIRRSLEAAGLDTAAGPMRDVTDTIRRALASGGWPPAAGATGDEEAVIDVETRVVGPESPPAGPPVKWPGTFDTFRFSNRAGTRAYKLYVPARPSDAPRPVVVMLHGCTQSTDDFALGTRMNQLAEQHGFLVVYPEQSAQANASRCWNWFEPKDQQREAGEPSLIAGIVREVAAQQGADLGRVFVAGLSAGGAMAAVLAQTHPDLLAGVGVHSGLPYGSASDIPSALAAMKGGRSGLAPLRAAPGMAGQPPTARAVHAVPTIVFHGDRDHTVQQTNGIAIVEQAKQAHMAGEGGPLHADVQRGAADGGRTFTRTAYADGAQRPRIELWTVHGAGHAWSGGDPAGSFADRQGPDASAEMVRFFLQLPRAASV